MKIHYQCSNCGKNFKTSAMVGIPHGMFDLGDRVVGDVFYCCDCVASWAERNGKPFDEQYKEPWKMFKRWWNRTVKEQAEKEGKEVKTYHRTVTGGFAEGE